MNPGSYQTGPLSTIADVLSGFAFKSEWFCSTGDKIVRIGDLFDNQILQGSCVCFDADKYKIPGYCITREGDILMALSGATTGKIGIAKKQDAGLYVNQRIAIIRGKCDENKQYLKYVFSGENQQKLLLRAGGAAQANLSPNSLREMIIPLPPLAEQKRIAAILNNADAIRHKRRQAIKLADDFLRVTFLDMFGDPVTNPKGWPRATLGTLIKLKSGDFLPANKMLEGNIPVYGGNGINGYHNEHMFDHSMIVIGRVGVYCGAIHKTEPKSWVTDNALYVAEKSDAVTDLYLEWSLRMANLNQYASQAGQPLISGGRIYPVEINLPPMNLQKEFEKVQITHSEMKEKIFKTSDQGEELFNSLTQRAFRGEL